MKILHTGDWHIDARDKYCGLDEQLTILHQMANMAEDQGCELALVAGDIFERQSSTADEREVLLYGVTALAESMPVVVIPGNHDGRNEFTWLPYVNARHRIHVADRPVVVAVASRRVACLPWPSKSALAQHADSYGRIQEGMQAAVGAILAGFAVQSPDVLLAHCDLLGATYDSGQTSIGSGVSTTLEDLYPVAPYCALGHVHRRQIDGNGEGRTVAYCGGIRQRNFGEAADKGALVVELIDGQIADLLALHLDGPRLITVALSDIDDTQPVIFHGAHVRLQYRCREDERQDHSRRAGLAKQKILDCRAVSVTMDATVEPVERVRAEEIRSARTVKEQIEAYWSATERPARAEQMIAKLEGTNDHTQV